jgi:hypothetical protein
MPQGNAHRKTDLAGCRLLPVIGRPITTAVSTARGPDHQTLPDKDEFVWKLHRPLQPRRSHKRLFLRKIPGMLPPWRNER